MSVESKSIEIVKKKIFPVYINDVYVSYPTDLLSLVKFSSANIDTSNISKTTIEYLIKIKKFMESDIVYSLADDPEIDFIHLAIKDIYESNISGDIVEAGVWRGGMGIWMNYIVHEYNPNPRKIWLFDSYEGFPNPKHPKDQYVHPVTKILYGKNASVEEVKNNFDRFGLLTNNLYFVKGEYEKSIFYVDIPQISILHLDCDYYDPTLLMLERYYPKMSKGSYVIINNYYYEYVNVGAAIDEFRKKYNITHSIQKLSNKYAFWRVE
jgi:hypothetical protein